MKRKIFISIDIPDKIRKRLTNAIEKWRDLPPHQFQSKNQKTLDSSSNSNLKNWCGGVPVKWTKEGNLHVTLVFLGMTDEESIPEICAATAEAAARNEIFDITFNQIEPFPSIDEPRTVALVGEANENLKNLVNDIEKNLGLGNAQKKSFRPHITLGRVRKYKWEALESKPNISEKFPLTLSVESVRVMASDFEEDGREYTVLESCLLR